MKLSSEPVIFFYTIIFTINYTVLPQLVLKKVCLMSMNVTQCKDASKMPDNIQKEASVWWFCLLALSLVPSVFTVLVWGSITDIIGRRRAMILVPFINGIRALVYMVNAYFLDSHPGYLMFGSVLSCFYGEFQGVVALCYAYMADITQNQLDQRTMRMAFIEASLFAAGVPAGLMAGYLLEKIGYIAVFLLTFGTNFLTLIYVVFFLPERAGLKKASENTSFVQDVSRETQQESKNDIAEIRLSSLLNPFTHLKQVILVITSPECRRYVLPLLFAFGLSVCAVLGELIVQTLYLSHRPFNFSPQMLGYYSACQSAIRGIGVILITQVSFQCLHLTDYSLIVIGLLSQMTCYILIGFSRSTLTVFLVNLSGLAVPVATSALRSAATKQVSKNYYGSVLSSLEAMDAIGGVITNALSLWTYHLTLTIYSGVVFFSLASFSFVSFFIVLGVHLRVGNSINPEEIIS